MSPTSDNTDKARDVDADREPAAAPGDDSGRERFLELANRPSEGLASEFVAFLRENKKWWLVPLLLGFGIVGALIVFGSSAAGPFVYTLF